MIAAPLRLVLAVLLAAFLAACQGLGTGPAATPDDRPTAEETQEPEDTDEPEESPDETDDAEASPDETDEGDGGSLSVFDLEVGDCFNVDDEAESIEEVEGVDCEDEHLYEVFALVDHPGDEFPGDADLEEFAFEECEERFEDYVGTAYDDSIYYITYLTPSEGSWEEGDREVVCILEYGPEGEPVEGSARDSGD